MIPTLELLCLQKFPYKLQQMYTQNIPAFKSHMSENYVFGLVPKSNMFKALKKFQLAEILPEYLSLTTYWLISWIQNERWLTIRVMKDFSSAEFVSSSFGWINKLSRLWKNRKLTLYDKVSWIEIDTNRMYFI